MVKVLGLDIGGANTKATFLSTKGKKILELRTSIEYFPIWKNKKNLPLLLEKLKKKFTTLSKLDGVAVTITAEVSDAYFTKKEGINEILDYLILVFSDTPIFVLDINARLLTIEDARKNPLEVASVNWVATGWMVSQIIRNCIIIDVGSTTTSIIPIFGGKIFAKGKNDLEKLQVGELVYSGSLRTNVAAIVDQIPVFGIMTRVSSELFAQSADIHLLLGNIGQTEYIVETCDGRGNSEKECLARLARVICADIDLINEEELMKIAEFIYLKQVDQIINGLKQVNDRFKNRFEKKIAVVTGLGRIFLARKAAENLGFEEIIDMGTLLECDKVVVTPSVGIALLMVKKISGIKIKWTQF